MVIKKRYILAILWLSTISLYGHATATATIDRNVIAIDETFELKLTLDEASFFDKPDVSALENHFTLLGSQKSSQTSYINGQKTALTQWVFQLAPKLQGLLTIPAIDIDGEKTQPLALKVTPVKKHTGSVTDPVFMEAITDKNSVYVQEQLLLTIRINSSINVQSLQLDNLEVNDAFVKEVSNTRYERTLNNTPYITYEIVYAIFPQTSGELSIPSLAASGVDASSRQYNSFFGGGPRIRLRTEALTVTVKEIPEKISNNTWLPAQNLILKETWSADPDNINVGDSITRTITTTATGLSAEQLPPVTMQSDTHYKVYAEKPALSDNKTNEGITGERKDAIALVATEPGEVILPEIAVQWWDIASNSLKTEVLPAVTIQIKGTSTTASIANGNTTNPVMPAPRGSPDTNIKDTSTDISPAPDNGNLAKHVLAWQIATAFSSCLAIAFFLLYMRARKHSSTQKTNDTSIENTGHDPLKALRTACISNHPANIRLALLAWAKHEWPNITVHSTGDISRLINNGEIDEWLKKMDAQLYNNERGAEDWMVFYALIAAQEKHPLVKNEKTLAPLYPR